MGAIGMCFCQCTYQVFRASRKTSPNRYLVDVVAITGTVAGTTDLPAQRASIAFVCFYIFFFASSWGPVAWVVTGELFPLKARAKCLSMTVSVTVRIGVNQLLIS